MYKEGFVATIRSNGQILKEHKGNIYLPFNSEYTVYLKNTTDKDASVTISIDNLIVYENILVEAKSSKNIKGFEDGYAFKFIKMSNKIANHRGTTPLDGKIKIEFNYKEDSYSSILKELEKYSKKEYIPVPYPVPTRPWPRPYPYDHPYYPWERPYIWSSRCNVWSSTDTSSETITWTKQGGTGSSGCGVGEYTTCCCAEQNYDSGITTKGNFVNPTHTKEVNWNSQVYCIEFTLKGNQGKPINTSTKIQCHVCGTKAKTKFCGCCGTNLF